MKKSQQEILSIVSREIHNASGYIGGELVARRKKSLEYYLGMPLGNEQEGRSSQQETMFSHVKVLDQKMKKWLDNVQII